MKIESDGWYAYRDGLALQGVVDSNTTERLDLSGNPLTEADVGRWLLWVGPNGPFDPIKIDGKILIGFLEKQSSRSFRRLTAREVRARGLEPEPSPGKEIDGINPFSPAQPSEFERLKEFFFAEKKPLPKPAPPEKPKDVCPCCLGTPRFGSNCPECGKEKFA